MSIPTHRLHTIEHNPTCATGTADVERLVQLAPDRASRPEVERRALDARKLAGRDQDAVGRNIGRHIRGVEGVVEDRRVPVGARIRERSTSVCTTRHTGHRKGSSRPGSTSRVRKALSGSH